MFMSYSRSQSGSYRVLLQIFILAKCPKHDLKFADMSSEGKSFSCLLTANTIFIR